MVSDVSSLRVNWFDALARPIDNLGFLSKTGRTLQASTVT